MSKIETAASGFWNFIMQGGFKRAALFVFTGAFLLRLPTVFMDFIHVDVVTSYVLVKRDLAGLAFHPNKGWLNHYLVKGSIELFGDSVNSFHLTGIIFILLTMVFILLLGAKVYNLRSGLIAAMLYGFIISSYNTEFIATNGEVLYNLFFMSTFYFSYLLLFERKIWALLFSLLSVYLGYRIKFQGSFSIAAVAAYVFIVIPYFSKKIRPHIRKYYALLALFAVLFIVYSYIDWNYLKIVYSGKLRGAIAPMVKYVANRGFSPLLIIGKLLLRSVHFLLYHSIIWVPGVLAVYSFFKEKEKSQSVAYVVIITIAVFLTVFLGGARLSVHYFIAVLPTLSILAAGYIYQRVSDPVFSRRSFLVFIIPVIFFFAWNSKDVYIKHCRPEWKQDEGKFAYYFRMIALASHGEYLLPHKSIVPVLNYLKEQTPADATVLSWPMGTEIVYYSGRNSAGYSYWYNEQALYSLVEREKGNVEVYRNYQKGFIGTIKKNNPDYFVDVGSTSMIRKVLIYRKKTDPRYYFDWNTAPVVRFGSFGSLDEFPDIISFLNRNYKFIGDFGKARVWKKIK